MVTFKSEDEFAKWAYKKGSVAVPGDILLLDGEMGVGKTTFVRHFVAGAGSDAWVSSPTFGLIHHYEGKIPIVHMDLYRLTHTADLELLDLDFLLQGGHIVLIEWPALALPLLGDLPRQTLAFFYGETPEVRVVNF